MDRAAVNFAILKRYPLLLHFFGVTNHSLQDFPLQLCERTALNCTDPACTPSNRAFSRIAILSIGIRANRLRRPEK
ncbi:MAG TPA: hypothetical protein DHW63_12790 [Hyphomonadaceae bacterium]|nr:hypothetical protein [Hyphomonadaceae bacterium]